MITVGDSEDAFKLAYPRFLVELADLDDCVVWVGDTWLRHDTYSMEETYNIFLAARDKKQRVRVHVTEPGDVLAYEAEFSEITSVLTWLPVSRITKGPQTPMPHPAYRILEDIVRVKQDRSCVFNLANGIAAALRQYQGQLYLDVVTPHQHIQRTGSTFYDTAYEFVGMAARAQGSMILHVYNKGENEETPHRVYLATTQDNLGLAWRPEEETFEHFNISLELVKRRFHMPEDEIAAVESAFTPSCFAYDFPPEGETRRAIPDR